MHIIEMDEKIQFYRKATNLTQKHISDLSRVSEISIYQYETGDNELLEIKLHAINIETVCSIILPLERKVEYGFYLCKKTTWNIGSPSIQMHF